MMNLTFVNLYVDDPVRSARFYADLLGEPLEASPTFVMFKSPSGLHLGLWSRHGVEPAAQGAPGMAEIAFIVDDVDARFADWHGRGYSIIQEPTDMDFGRTFCAVDPDGHRLRVFKPA